MLPTNSEPTKDITTKCLSKSDHALVAWRESNESPLHGECWTSSKWRASVRRGLLRWFKKESRDLPWRSDSTPYRVWVSEIMLQQTQVATVVEYYHRFMDSFPTIHALAEASEQEVLAHWEGLGYYRRARSLHAAARVIVEQHDAKFPCSYEEVIALPGIGRYTAGAILSISQGQRLPILEGNTQRVFSRWIGMRGPVTDRAATKLLWKFAEAMLPTRNPGNFNQAAMEIGALLCRPTEPDCKGCPVASSCEANRLGLQGEIPGKVKKVVYEDRREFAFVIKEKPSDSTIDSSRYLVRLLPEGVRWAGLWDFPRTTEQSYESALKAGHGLSAELGFMIVPGEKLASLRHAVTRFRIDLQIHESDYRPFPGDSWRVPKPWKFATVTELDNLPMSVSGRKIVDRIRKQESNS